MTYKYFSRNGQILLTEQAFVPLSNIAYSYGFGVYESIRVSKGVVYFADEHCDRLMRSAKVISLEHPFTSDFVKNSILELLGKLKVDSCNIKILLIGGKTAEEATLNIMCLNPLFPDRKLYKTGATCTTYNYEREYPGAKTLNMLSSYLAYRQAKQAGAYEALLINRQGCITEGTRTNFFVIKNKTIVSPPAKYILPGVTRNKVIEVAKDQGFEIIEQDIKIDNLDDFDGAFLTSTSAKIMPINSIGDFSWGEVSPQVSQLIVKFNSFLGSYSN